MVEKAHQFIINLVDSHRGSRTWGYFHFTLAFRRKNPEKVVKEATIAERREQIRERVGDIF
jgi:hypothetical protein